MDDKKKNKNKSPAWAVVVLLLMLGSLFSWLRQDLAITFADLTDNITDAVIIGK